MIEIRRHEGGFSISGHAGYAPHGQDIVCAAISALFQTFVESVSSLTSDKLKCDISADMAVIRYENLSERGQLLEDSFFLGVTEIAIVYPDNVRIVSKP